MLTDPLDPDRPQDQTIGLHHGFHTHSVGLDHCVTFGQPLMPDPAEVGKLLSESVDSGWLTNGGPLVSRLESALKPRLIQATGAAHLVSSGTMALMVALQLGKLPPGAEVITSPLSFAATVQAIAWCGFQPVFADVDPVTLNLCPDAVRAAITPRTAAIVPVHFLGVPCDVQALAAIASAHRLWLAYDAAHAFGLEVQGVPIAAWGDASAFSFHATKLMHTGEGGAVVTPSPSPDLLCMRAFGLAGGRMVAPGINAKMAESQAAVGLSVLRRLDAEIQARQSLRRLYNALFGELDGVDIQQGQRTSASESLLYYPLRMTEHRRERVMFALRINGFMARDHFPLLCGKGTWLPERPIISAKEQAAAPVVAPEVLCLPFHGRISARAAQRMAQIVRDTA